MLREPHASARSAERNFLNHFNNPPFVTSINSVQALSPVERLRVTVCSKLLARHRNRNFLGTYGP
jgi:hypothetical protein